MIKSETRPSPYQPAQFRRIYNPDSPHPIEESLHRRRIQYVCHMTPCHRLPDIINAGGLLSLNARRSRGINELDTPHYWGSPGKEEELADYVVCAFMPPWGMIKDHKEELAIILLDAVKVCCKKDVVFCPTNSAYNDYSADMIKSRSGIYHFDACFQNPDTYMAGDSEILIPHKIPIDHFRYLTFCDEPAMLYWTDKLPGLSIPTTNNHRFRFPPNWAPTDRIRHDNPT